jgi:hypothetical protein
MSDLVEDLHNRKREGALRTAYPSMTDPRQAYTASTNSAENKE